MDAGQLVCAVHGWANRLSLGDKCDVSLPRDRTHYSGLTSSLHYSGVVSTSGSCNSYFNGHLTRSLSPRTLISSRRSSLPPATKSVSILLKTYSLFSFLFLFIFLSYYLATLSSLSKFHSSRFTFHCYLTILPSTTNRRK